MKYCKNQEMWLLKKKFILQKLSWMLWEVSTKIGHLKKIKTNLLSNWCGQKVEGFCIQDYSLVSKFYIHFKAVKGEKYQWHITGAIYVRIQVRTPMSTTIDNSKVWITSRVAEWKHTYRF